MELVSNQAMTIRHADSTDDCSHNTNETLIGSAEKNIWQMGGPVKLFIRGAVNRAVVVPGKSADGLRGEHIGVNHIATKVWHKLNRGSYRGLVLLYFGGSIFIVW